MSEDGEWESIVHDEKTCNVKDCEACLHGLPPGCGCSNLGALSSGTIFCLTIRGMLAYELYERGRSDRCFRNVQSN